MENRIKELIKRLRRGDYNNAYETFDEFDRYVVHNIDDVCKTFSLRWLISIVDTYADHSDSKAEATMISVFANMVKLSDTLICNTLVNIPQWMKDGGVIPLYDEVNTFKITDGDMSQAMFFRIERALDDVVLKKLWAEIKKRFMQQSLFLRFFSIYHEDFFKPAYFEKRKNFLNNGKI